MRQDATLRKLEVIGQAVKNLSERTKSRQPDIPWKQIAGMRDKVIHDYFGVNLEIGWAVVQKELPKLSLVTAALLKNPSVSGSSISFVRASSQTPSRGSYGAILWVPSGASINTSRPLVTCDSASFGSTAHHAYTTIAAIVVRNAAASNASRARSSGKVAVANAFALNCPDSISRTNRGMSRKEFAPATLPG